jgi:hypothetical protein
MKPTRTIIRIRVKGRLGPEWSTWFDGLTVQTLPGGDSVLTGPLPDQAALHGILLKVRNLGLELLSLSRVESPLPPA